MKESATLLESVNKSMSKYLNSRADSFLSNNYFDSDAAWLEVDEGLFDITTKYANCNR